MNHLRNLGRSVLDIRMLSNPATIIAKGFSIRSGRLMLVTNGIHVPTHTVGEASFAIQLRMFKDSITHLLKLTP